MLLPTQQAAFTAVTSVMGSVLDDIEKRRAEEEDKLKGNKDDKVLKTKIRSDSALSAANDKVNEHFFNRNIIDINELKVNLIEKLGEKLGIKKEDGQSGFSYGRQLESAIAQLEPLQVLALEEALGLRDLGVSLDTLIKAIKNPYGEEDDKLETALEEQATGQSGTATSRSKILQRLQGIADPKTLEELKLEKAGEIGDPTKIEDAETKAEREKDIAVLEAGEKLEDVKDLHEAVAQQNDEALESTGTGATGSGKTVEVAIDTIQVLAASAETIEDTAEADAAVDNGGPLAADALASETEATGPQNANGKNDLSLSEEDEITLLAKDGPDMSETTVPSILAIQVDENGIYDILLRNTDSATTTA